MAPTQVSGSLNYSNSKGTVIPTTKRKVAGGINHTYRILDQSITAKQRNESVKSVNGKQYCLSLGQRVQGRYSVYEYQSQ